MNQKYRELGAISVLIFLVLVFCQDLVFNGEVPFFRDLTNYFYPLRYSLYESLRAGEFPLWDRRFAQGFPNFAGLQLGALYPPHWLLLAFPFYAAIRAIFVLHFLIAAVGCFILLRYWKYPRDLSVVGAIVFTLGGVTVSLTNLLNHFQSAIWLPWLILTWEVAVREPRWRNSIYFTVIAAFQFLAGSPEFFALSLGLALLDGFRMKSFDTSVSFKRIVTVALGCTTLMLLLIMVQVLPTIELVSESRRGHFVPEVEAFLWSLKPIHLLNWLFLDKDVEPAHWLGVRLYFDRDLPFLVTTYLGAITWVSIPLWCYYAPRREKILLIGLAVASLGLAFGGNGLVYPFVFRYVPFISVVRFPEKFFFITYVTIFLMTMRGLHGFYCDQSKGLRYPLFILGPVTIIWISVYYFFQSHSEIISDFIATNTTIPPLSEQHAKATVSVLTNIQRQVFLTTAIFFLLILAKVDKIRPALVSVLLIALVYVDLTWAHKNFLFPLDPAKLTASKPVLNPADSRYSRYFYYPAPRNLHPAFFSVLGRPNFSQAVSLSYQNLMPNTGILQGMEYIQEIDALNRRPYNDFLTVANNIPFEDQVKLLRIFNVGHVVSFRELSGKGVKLLGRFPDYYSWLYKVDNAVPRAFMVGEISVAKTPGPTFKRLLSEDFDPGNEVVLDQPVAIKSVRPFKTDVQIRSYENSVVTIGVQTNSEGILVLADSYFPGWKAFIDGTETKIFKANHFYRAVKVPVGAHVIEFRYQPASFAVGLVISCITLSMIGLISIVLYLRARRHRASVTMSPIEALRA